MRTLIIWAAATIVIALALLFINQEILNLEHAIAVVRSR